MGDLFSGLESLGLGGIKKLDLYDKNKEKEKEPEASKKVEKPVIDEASLIFDKTCTCPVCNHVFKCKMVKAGKTKLVSQDIDLRPRYSDIDGLKYDVIVCPVCGYGALAKLYGPLSSGQIKLIKESIATTFTGLGPDKGLYSYDDAIMRHKLALVSTIVKRGKTSERAYVCLLLGWLTRGKRESLDEGMPGYDNLVKQLESEENEFLLNAKEGFQEAFSSEMFPLCGLDEPTSIYLVAALSAKTGSNDEALRWASRLITSNSASERIKDKARLLKEKIQAGEKI